MIEEIAPDFYRVQIPLPDLHLKTANSYVVRDGEHSLITDTGMDNEDGFRAMQPALKRLDVALDIDRVLPGHRATLGNCKARIEEIRKHHHQRNLEVLAILRQGSRNIHQVASRMTWNIDSDSWDSFPVVQSFFATGEAFAHLRYLEEDSLIIRKTEGQTARYQIRAT